MASKLKYKIYKRPIGPSGYGGASALESICIDGHIMWIIKCDIRGSNANKYAKIYKLNLKNGKLSDTHKTFSNLGHANGCTFYNGCIYVATSGRGIARVNVSTWKSKKISDIYCTGIDYCGDDKFILQRGGNSYGLYSFNGKSFKKINSFTLKRYGSYTTNQDITYNGGSIYRVAITGGKGASAVMVYNYDGGSGTYKPKKVYTCGGELESIIFYKGTAYISNNMSAPGDAIVKTSSFKGSDTSEAPSTGGTSGDGGGTAQQMPIEYPSVVEITGFYEFYSGQDNSQVISFSPEWENMSAQGGEWLVQSASSVDEIRNELISVQVSGGDYRASNDKVGSIMGKSTSSMQSLEAQSKSMWEKNYSRMNKANMEIMGDPDTYPGKYIYVDVYTKYGFRHHTSGIYYVEEAEDNISEGSFTTSLQLRKYGTYSHYYNSLLEDSDGGIGTDSNEDSDSGLTRESVINGACEWAIKIAKDNSFHYGHGDAAHHFGCYFCGTNKSRKKGHGILDWEKTYCCNPFVYSAYAHGGKDPDMLKSCKKGGNSDTGTFQGHKGSVAAKRWDKLGKISKSKLKKGDVLAYYNGGHWALYVGDGKIAEAAMEDDNKRHSKKWNDSIRVCALRTNYSYVCRYNGKGLPKKSGGKDYLGGVIGNPYGGKTKFKVTSIACAVGYDSAHAGRMHDGWDYAVGGNAPIYAVTSGKVVSAGPLGGYGNHVVVMKADNCNMYVLYGHMSSMNVKKGDKVKMGQKIGNQGSEGNSTGKHLHLEFRKGKNSSSNSTANLNNVDPMMKKYATNYSSIKKDYHLIKRKN